MHAHGTYEFSSVEFTLCFPIRSSVSCTCDCEKSRFPLHEMAVILQLGSVSSEVDELTIIVF